ncbi:MAG: hypothetical protein EBR82_59375 [Caulobacteraceae bacterium]|nr:hypothetical protein [Caulobacteraceae bacterium]
MQLEPLLTNLGIPQFIPQLSEFRDDILRDKAAELKSLTDTHADELAIVQAELAAKNALIDSVKNAIKDDHFVEVTEMVSAIKQVFAEAELPSVKKRKLEIAAEIAAKQAELEALTV